MKAARADLHVHSRHSRDARGSVMDLARAARAAGLAAFALTDHDTVAGHQDIRAAQDATGILVVPGIEVTSAEGHVLALGVDARVPRGLGLAETVQRVEEQGGVAVAAHPLRMLTGIGPTTLRQRALDGAVRAAEGRNARERMLVQQNTERLVRSCGLAATGGSDAHWITDVGTAWTAFPQTPADVDGLLDMLRRGQGVPGGGATPRRHILRHRAQLARDAFVRWARADSQGSG